MEYTSSGLGLANSPIEAAIASSLRALNDQSCRVVCRRFLSALITEVDAQAAGVMLHFHDDPFELIHAPSLPELQKSGLKHLLQSGRSNGLGSFCKHWQLENQNRLMLVWKDKPNDAVLTKLANGHQQLRLFVRQLQQLHAVEDARLAWQYAVRHQAILSETLAWLGSLDSQTSANELYAGLLKRTRILCNADMAALRIHNHKGELTHFIHHQLEAALLDQAVKQQTQSPDPASSWLATVSDRKMGFMEVQLATHNRGYVRLFVANKRDRAEYIGFAPQDEAYVNQLMAQVFRAIEKNELMEDLKISNRFLAMERHELRKTLSDLKGTQQQLLHSEKLASIGQLAAGVAHEVNNPLSFVNSNLFHLHQYCEQLTTVVEDYLSNSPDNEHLSTRDWQLKKRDLNELLAETRDGVERVRQIVLDLRDFSRIGNEQHELTDINHCLESSLNLARNELKYKVTLTKDYGEIPLIFCSADQISQVILNLIVNAAHAIEEAGCLHVRSGMTEDRVFFEVTDTGKGIPEHIQKQIFNPFFTTKPVGQGTGLGLSLSYGIIERHGGTISVQSTVGEGSTFRVTLPAAISKDDTTHVITTTASC